MAVVKQVFDNCENHGLEHSWESFELREVATGGYVSGSGSFIEGGLVGIPQKVEPEPYKTKIATHVRRCRNCKLVEEFIENDEGYWAIKPEK